MAKLFTRILEALDLLSDIEPLELLEPSSRPSKQHRPAADFCEENWLRRNGWSKKGDREYRGRFRTGFGIFKGRVERRRGGFQVYIKDPPDWVLEGKHSECLHPKEDGWWWLHQNRYQPSLASTIRSMEAFLMEKHDEHLI